MEYDGLSDDTIKQVYFPYVKWPEEIESQKEKMEHLWLIPLSKWVITPVINGIFVGLIHLYLGL